MTYQITDLVKDLRWPRGLSSPDDHPISVALRVAAADEIERLRRRVVVLETIIREDLSPDDCSDDLNRMIVEGVLATGSSDLGARPFSSQPDTATNQGN